MRFTLPTVALFLLSSLGCCSDRVGSSVTVGEGLSFPEASNASNTIKVRAFQSIKGAKVWTAKDSLVIAKYRNAYTNSYFFNTVVLKDAMHLDLVIIPLDTSSATTGTTCSASGVLSPDGSQPNSP